MKFKMKLNLRLILGLKHIEPFVEDAVKQMHDDGIKEAVSHCICTTFFNIQREIL